MMPLRISAPGGALEKPQVVTLPVESFTST